MSVFLNVRKTLVISLIVVILDGLLVYYLPSYFNKLNYFYPMLTISLIPFIYLINKKDYYLIIIILGIIYDLLYSNIFLYNVILFLIIISIDIKIMNYYKNSLILFVLLTILNIFIYDFISFILIILTGYQFITFFDLIYKIKHSIFLNIMSVYVYWFLFKNII